MYPGIYPFLMDSFPKSSHLRAQNFSSHTKHINAPRKSQRLYIVAVSTCILIDIC